jgi:hypothetical protein
MGLGNTRHAAGDLRGAAAAFNHAARKHDSAAAWNNLAQTLHELGDAAGARAAAGRAVQRARAAEPAMLDTAAHTLQQVR